MGKTLEQAMLEMDMAEEDGVICFVNEVNMGCDCCDSDWQTFYTPATIDELVEYAAEQSAYIATPRSNPCQDSIDDSVSEVESVRIIVDEMNRRAEAAARVHSSLGSGWL
jgi:hypothetical protein